MLTLRLFRHDAPMSSRNYEYKQTTKNYKTSKSSVISTVSLPPEVFLLSTFSPQEWAFVGAFDVVHRLDVDCIAAESKHTLLASIRTLMGQRRRV